MTTKYYKVYQELCDLDTATADQISTLLTINKKTVAANLWKLADKNLLERKKRGIYHIREENKGLSEEEVRSLITNERTVEEVISTVEETGSEEGIMQEYDSLSVFEKEELTQEMSQNLNNEAKENFSKELAVPILKRWIKIVAEALFVILIVLSAIPITIVVYHLLICFFEVIGGILTCLGKCMVGVC